MSSVAKGSWTPSVARLQTYKTWTLPQRTVWRENKQTYKQQKTKPNQNEKRKKQQQQQEEKAWKELF